MTDIINVVYLKPELIEKGLWVRTHKTGDSLSPVGHNWTKTLKSYIDMKVPRHMRPESPLLQQAMVSVQCPIELTRSMLLNRAARL